MRKLFLRSLVTALIGDSDRKKAIKLYFVAFFFCCLSIAGYGQVTITQATGGTLICASKAVGGTSAGYTTLGPITIAETVTGTGDINGVGGPVVNTIILSAPSGWQFNPTLPGINYATGANITAISGSITASTLTLNITVNGSTAGDQFSIVGLQVQATSAGAPAGNIYASSVSGINGVTAGISNFGSLSVNPLVTPSVVISGSPGSVICAGASNVFTPTHIGGGPAPTYTWYLNGLAVAAGPSYINSSLATGSSVMCIMNSTATCITTSTATSNTITMVVNPVPSAIIGSVNVCPGGSASLSNASGSGAWSSAHPTIATVNSVGKVFGVAAGNAVISYTAAGCAATTVATIHNIPAIPVITPSVSAVCNNSILSMTATGVSVPPAVMSQALNSSLSPWTVDNTGSVGTLPASEWKQCIDGFSNALGVYHSPDNSGFAMANADASPSTSITYTQLISPAFSLVGYASASLTFQHAYEKWPNDYAVQVDISTTGGASWTTLYSYLGTNVGNRTNFVSEAFSLNPYVGMANLKIRFLYHSNWGYYWVLDNILVSGASAGVVPAWTPITYLYTDAAATVPYAGTQTNTIYLKTSGITSATQLTYTASATNAGCSSQATNTITVNPSPGVFSGSTNLCIGRTSIMSNEVAGGTWSSSNSSVATVVAATGAITGASTGTANITYRLAGGCYSVITVTVFTAPSAIFGNTSVCAGSSVQLSATPGTGTWSSGNSSVATVASGSGLTFGASAGNSPVTYTLSAGCQSVTTVTVNPVPSAIVGGAPTMCSGTTLSFSDAVAGGTWSVSNTALATINTLTGELSGFGAGAVNVSYSLPGNCYVLKPLIIYQQPGTITGATSVCQGLSTILSNAASGGVWTSDNTSVATVASGTPVVNGVSAGNAGITYTVGTSCIAVTTVIVNPLPATITGPAIVCSGSSIALTDVTPGGTWTTGNATTATVDASGIVTAGTAGVVNITYTLNTGCIASKAILVNPLPAAITGINTVCIGMTTSFSDITAAGTWSSSNTGIATVVQSSGLISGVSAGVANITYMLNTGCFVTRSVTVNGLPSPITAPSMVCVGLTAQLSNSVPGGSWTSGNAFASVNGSSGVVTGLGAGVASITYTLGTSCMVSTTMQVNPLSPITGIANVCEGLTTTLSNATPGGTWSSSNSALATITLNTGLVNGTVQGNVIISYMLPTGCATATTVVVNPIPDAISGNTNICLSGNTVLSDGGAGTWSSSNTTIATVDVSSGIVSGMSLGNARITYSLSAGCIAITTVVVNPVPANISGPVSVCVGSAIVLTDGTVGGTWSSSNTLFATVTGTGLVSGAGAGPVTITYMLPTGCFVTKNITVFALPAPIAGITDVCVGAATILSNSSGSGTWSSSNSSIATVLPGSGVVSGSSAGTVLITFGVSTGCSISTSVVVNPLPAAITGTANFCFGLTTSLSSTTAGGTWSSSNTSVATVGGSGLVTSVAAGTATITYTLGTGCVAVKPVIVYPPPDDVLGNTVICSGGIAVFTCPGGGTWSSSNTAIATVGLTTGLATGGAAGLATITYTLNTGCISTMSLLVNPLPAVITGNTGLCMGFTTTLSTTSTGGTWSSSNTSVATATLSGSGIVTSVGPGIANITYTLPTGCTAQKTVTVNPLPNDIIGANAVCIGQSIALLNFGGGTWSSSNSSVATVVAASGTVFGVSSGTSVISYSLNTGCYTTTTITVNALPAAITGPAGICQTQFAAFSNATTGGTWSSSATVVASIDPASGIAQGFTLGNATLTYTLGTGCISTRPVTVNPLPSAIVGQLSTCVTSAIAMSDATPSGTWSTTNTGVAVIGISTGVLTAVSTGTVTIVYTLNTGCSASRSVTINAQPPAISGNTSICFGSSTILSNTSIGGTWSSSNMTVAQVNPASGQVIGLSAGSATIVYTVDVGCTASAVVNVNPLPGVITGYNSICVGQGTSFSNAATGGTWSSTNTAIAAIGLTNGIATGVSPGVAIVSYMLPTGCGAAISITVNASPSPISGNAGICIAGSTTLSNTVSGGTWSSSNTNIAAPNLLSGVVSGILPGTATISYILPGNCAATTLVTVNSLPNPIQGTSILCTGVSSQLSSTTPGGAWISSNTSIATVSAGGVVYGVGTGTVVIAYTMGTGCSTTKTIGVFASPGAISGASSICVGAVSAFSNTVSGGVWTSSNTLTAQVDASGGDVIGILPGAANVIYTVGGTCSTSAPITVFASPAAISGVPVTCIGLTTNLSNVVGGGTWSSSNTSVATVTLNGGVVRGVAQGIAVISYKMPGGCFATASVTISPQPSGIGGVVNTCLGFVTQLSNASPGGTWSSSNTIVAQVNSATGSVTAIIPGTTFITYSIVSGCSTTTLVTVNTIPAGITGVTTLCIGTNTRLSSATAGGTWTSANTSVATIVSSTGFVTGISPGVSSVHYTLSTGCYAARNVTVSTLPTAISGPTNVCLGSPSPLSNGTPGGTWTSSNSSIATVDPVLGAVYGALAGNAVINYSFGAGCTSTYTVSVISAPAAISGPNTLCIGQAALLSSATSGGVWSSSNTSVATVPTVLGIVASVAPGTSVISYSIGTGCVASATMTVTNPPSAITGSSEVCVGTTIQMSNGTAGGTWSSPNTLNVVVAGPSGFVTGLAPGIANITYTLAAGCTASATVAVNALPANISGSSLVCVGLTTQLSNATMGGTWSSGNTNIVTVDQVSGLITGVAIGTANITYALGTGCFISRSINVSPLPSAISGVTAMCVGGSTSLSNTVPGGTWTSANTSIFTIGSLSGGVSGISAGIADVTYSLGSGCIASAPVTIIPLPPAIIGNTDLCIGTTTILSNASTPGTWSGATSSVATVDAATGQVVGLSTGNSVITYTAATGCSTTTTVIVNPPPGIISGVSSVCVAATIPLSNAGGGTWSSGNTAILLVNTFSGVVTGINAGTAHVTYTLGTGCLITKTVTVLPLPPAITGNANICSGNTSMLSNSVSGGTWSSASVPIASVGINTGLVTAGTPGSAVITYRINTGCAIAVAVIVSPVPSAITGPSSVCEGSTIILSNTGSGTWSSNNTTVASVLSSASGAVAGIDAGSANITYSLGTGCTAVKTITVNALPLPITGTTTICAGTSAPLSSSSAGGTWTSVTTTVAVINTAGGVVTGIASGSSVISYSLNTGCSAITTVNVNPVPATISGIRNVCVGATTMLSNVGGGTWISGTPGVATVHLTSGEVTGIGAGNARITYTVGTGCIAVTTVTVNALPPAITGNVAVCVGASTTLSDAGGGTWLSASLSVATIGTSSGVVGGVSAGTSVITYTLGTGCTATTTITVHPLPSAISGPSGVCIGSATTLSNTGGGVWSSGNMAIATIGSSTGVVSGITLGTARITYTLSTGCITVTTIAVNPLPSAITGLPDLCIGLTTNLSDAGGGTWISSNTNIATAGLASGIITGVSAGNADITYTLPTGCTISRSVTVRPVPTPVSGISSICVGATTMLSEAITGGTWVSSNNAVATVGLTSGLVTGGVPGTAAITYLLGAGCSATLSVVVQTTPGVISGLNTVCIGATRQLSDMPGGGLWSSSNSSLATIDPSSGLVYGIAQGAVTISYTLGSGCMVTRTQTVNPISSLSGTSVICAGENTTLSTSMPGGIWSSSSTTVATVSSAGMVYGVAGGTTNIIYTLSSGCSSAFAVQINPAAPILGASAICLGNSTTMVNTVGGGTWSSANPSVATISNFGVVQGLLVGNTVIRYSLPSGCVVSASLSVDPVPGPIVGNTNVCIGATTYLTDAPGGGTWSHVAPTGILGIGLNTGAVTGLVVGSQPVTYTSPSGCSAVTTITVHPPPSSVSGAFGICEGASALFTCGTPSGVWSTGNASIATIDAGGLLYGMAAGSTMVTYTTGIGCISVRAVTINPLPAPITGSIDVCAGGSVSYVSDATPGGVWTSLMVTVSPTGLVTAASAGMASITYALPTGCYRTTMLNVNPLPVNITGTMNACVGASAQLSNGTSGGYWSTFSTSLATVSALGLVTGLSAGTAVISYTNASGCTVTALFTVHPLPPAIIGPGIVCEGSSVALSNTMGGGAWSSGIPLVATIGAGSGVVSGLTAGGTIITYTSFVGCSITKAVTVSSLPVAISGVNAACLGSTSQLSDSPSGGTWSSASPSIASVGITSGLVTGVAVGVTTLTYTLGTGCIRTVPFTVNPLPVAISGPAHVCFGATASLSNAGGSGVWSSANAAIATVGFTTGVVTGVAGGTVLISYALPTGCATTKSVTIDPAPAAYNVTGGGTICVTDSGRHINIIGSAIGCTYRLYRGATVVATFLGTGLAIDFGLYNVAGTYTVKATSNATGCTASMAGAATIIVNAVAVPTAVIVPASAYVCNGNPASYTASATDVGTMVACRWYVNGSYVTLANPFNYTPANGDVLTVVVSGNATCVSSPSVSAAYTVTVTPRQAPSVSIAPFPNDTVCAGTSVSYSPVPVFGGPAPAFQWAVNGMPASTAMIYSYTPANGDQVSCVMTSSHDCVSSDTVSSNVVGMTIVPYSSPSVSIAASPSATVGPGESITFTATPFGAGASPSYQWYINEAPVAGATNSTYTGNSFSNQDSVTCVIISNGMCSTYAWDYLVITIEDVSVAQVGVSLGDIKPIPNPNKGDFSIKGVLSSMRNDTEVFVEITNMIGQVIYRSTAAPKNGKLDEHIRLGSGLANGMYLLNLRVAGNSKVLHFVVEQ